MDHYFFSQYTFDEPLIFIFLKNMFSISAKPLHSIIEPDGKIIILTETQLLFTTLDSFENFRSINIMSSHPVTCYFAPEVLEVLVLAKNMIEIYYCDWQTNVYPCRVIVLNQAPIYTINYEQTTGWNIYGNREQMEITKVNFHSFPQQERNPQQLFCCFIEESQYILTTSGLFRVVKGEKQLIHWPLRQNVLKELKNRITSFQTFNRDHKHIICLEKKFILVIEEDQVTHTIYRDKITYIDNEIFMSKPIQNQRSVEEEKFAKQIGIKQLQNISDSAIGGRMFGKQLMYIEYKHKKLHLLSHFNSSLIGDRKGKRFLPTRRTSQKDSSNKTVSEQSQDFDDLMNEVQSSKSSDELSLKSNDILGRKESSLHRSKGKGKNNDLLHVSVQSNEVQTPGFVLMGSSDRFGSYNSDFKWVEPDNSSSLRASNQKLNDKVIKSQAKEAEVSFVIQEEESHLQSPSSEVPVLSDKVKMFKPPNKLATSSIIKTIQSKPHILLLSELERSDERKFKKAVKDSVWEWIKEKQASMFLARFITAEDQSEIKHQINELFQNGLTEQRKQIITSALKQFKLGDVPSHLLCFSGEFIQILLKFDRNVYIEQLLDPSQKTISRLTISFLEKIKQNPSQSTISLESRQIDLSHQKNILNVLFYLNDSLHLPQRSIILPFVRIMLQEGKLEVIAKIKEQEILKICQVQEKLYEHQIIQFIKQVEASNYSQKIKEQTKSTEDYMSKLVSLLFSEASSQYYVKIVILNDLIQKEVEFNSKILLDFNKQMSIKELLVQIIDSNSAGKLKSFKCTNIYKGLYWIKEKGKKLEGINTELSEILRILGEKLIARREYFQGFKKIRNIDGGVDSAFLGSLLEKYCEGKMLLRLKGKQRFCNMPEIFPQLMKKKIDPELFVNEGVQPPAESDEFSCNWNKFCWIYEKYLSTSNSLKILTFLDSKMSEKIFQLLQEPILFKYHQFKKQVTYYQPSLKKLSQSEHSYSQSSFVERQDFLLEDGHLASNDKKNTSTYIIPRKASFNRKGKSLSQGNSDQQSLHSAYHQLNSINNEEQIWKELQNIYNRSSELVFLDAASTVRSKIELYHIDKLKMLVEQNLTIKLQKILPFTLFKIEQNELALETITFDIRQIVTVENFWVIWNIIQLFFGYGDMVSLLLVEKIILWNRDDELFSIVKYLLTGNSWILDEELQNYLQFTEKLQMQKTNRCLKKIIFDLQHQI